MAQSSFTTSRTRARAYGGLTFPAGQDVTLTFTIEQTDGSAEPLSGDDLIWTLRRRGASRNALKKTVGDGITVTDESGGVATASISHSDTNKLRPGIYDHQLWLKDSSGAYEEIGRGLVRLQKQLVTDPPTQSEILEYVV